MGKKIQKQLFYKHAQFLSPEQQTLQVMFTKAISAVPIAQRGESSSSVTPTGTGGAWVRLVNSPRHYADFSFGVLVVYSPGIHHMVINLAAAEGKDELDVSKFPPPTGKQFMETPLYFAIKDNHIVLIQSKALRAADLERHLNWLFEIAGVMEPEQHIVLSDAIPQSTRKRLEKEPVRKIQIGVPLVEQSTAQTATLLSADAPTSLAIKDKVASVSKVALGKGIDVLKGFLAPKALEALKFDDLAQAHDIEVNVEIRVVGRRKKASKDEQIREQGESENRLMGALMRELRNVEDVDFLHIETEGGGHLHGGELRVQVEKGIDSSEGVLDTSHAFEVMRKWLVDLIGQHTIELD